MTDSQHSQYARQQELDATYLMQTYKRKPVEFVRGEGMRLYDDSGREYLDFLSGVGAVSVGHANPRVAQVLSDQAAKLLHVGNYFYVEGRGELAKKISDLLNASALPTGAEPAGSALPATGANSVPPLPTTVADPTPAAAPPPLPAWKSFFTNSGAESVEGAIKIARKYGLKHLEGADTIISARRSFHGRTLAALAATGQPSKQESFSPMPEGFIHVDLNDIQALKQALHRGFGGNRVCAVLLECIQGEGGVYPCSEEYLKAARDLSAESGALLIIDEVQTGFFRTGTWPFAFQHYGILPDVVTLAKGLGAGVPIGAVVARDLAAEVFEPGDHGSTFGGSPLVVAAANATLDELAAMDAATQVAEVGNYLQQRLAELPGVVDIRGRGLMVGVEFEQAIADDIVVLGLKHGLVLNNIGNHILRFLPPLVCTKQDVNILISRLLELWSEL